MSTRKESSNSKNSENISNISIETKFYEFLKDAQPIAFLGSFSIIIAVFAFPSPQFSSVFEFATISSAMFLISFVFSLAGRLAIFSEGLEKADRSIITNLMRFGTYFLFGVGLIYLILIISEFSKSTPSIKSIFYGGALLFLGLLFFFWFRKRIKKELKTDSIYQKIVIFPCYAVTASLVTYGLNLIIKAITTFEFISSNLEFILFQIIIGLMLSVIVLRVLHNKKTRRSLTIPTYNIGKTGNVLDFSILIILLITISIAISSTTQSDQECNMDCKIKYEKLGFICYEESENNFSCRFIAEEPITITIPEGTSTMPNERNFSPDNVIVHSEINNIIRLTNHDIESHKIFSDDLEEIIELNTNDTYVVRFPKEGTDFFHGTFSWMKGKIEVRPLDSDYNKENPLTQISNQHDVFYKIFRESDSWGFIDKLEISSNSISFIHNVTDSKSMTLGDSIIGNCSVKSNQSIEHSLKLVEINYIENPYAIFKETQKTESFEICK